MSSVLELDFQAVLKQVKQHTAQTKKLGQELHGRSEPTDRDKAILYCIEHAVDLALGCAAVAAQELPDSTTTLSRALLETLIWTRYVTLSENNAQEFLGSYLEELKRTARKNLSVGYAHIYERRTKADKTAEFLRSERMKNIRPRISIESAAKAGGLEKAYTAIYGFISMVAHGRACGLRHQSEAKEDLFASLSAALGAIECIEVMATSWLLARQQTPKETLTILLGL